MESQRSYKITYNDFTHPTLNITGKTNPTIINLRNILKGLILQIRKFPHLKKIDMYRNIMKIKVIAASRNLKNRVELEEINMNQVNELIQIPISRYLNYKNKK